MTVKWSQNIWWLEVYNTYAHENSACKQSKGHTPSENNHTAWKMNGSHTNYSTYPNQMPHTEMCSPSAPCYYKLHKQ